MPVHVQTSSYITKNVSRPDVNIMQKIMEALKEADSNNDGCFNKIELKRALKDLGSIFPGWRANRALRIADANNDGQISGEEIKTLLEYLHSVGFGK